MGARAKPVLATVAAVLGMTLGSALLIVVAWVYVNEQTFGLGGSVLSVLGVILVGLSIWSTVTISVTPGGGIEAKFEKQEERFLSLERVVTRVARGVKEVDQDISQFRSAMISTLSPEQVQSLREREVVDRLIDEGKYLEALQIDPENTIAIIRYIEQQVAEGNYREATQYFEQLRDDRSGVGHSAYPDLTLAFERVGEGETALSILGDLDRKVTDDITSGYGYLSRSQQMDWVHTDLLRVRAQVQDQQVANALDALALKLAETIRELREG